MMVGGRDSDVGGDGSLDSDGCGNGGLVVFLHIAGRELGQCLN